MKLLVIGVLATVVSVLLTVTLLLGYRADQRIVHWFPGTGIAAKVDVIGAPPSHISIADRRTGDEYTFAILDDGTFIAPLRPGIYDLELPGDGRFLTLTVPAGDCLDLVLDYRFPFVVLTVPREGWPLPAIAA
jgi:hypothetical protein